MSFKSTFSRKGDKAYLKIRQSSIWYAGLLGRWDKQLINQAFDVPSIIFFHNFL